MDGNNEKDDKNKIEEIGEIDGGDSFKISIFSKDEKIVHKNI